MISFKMTTTIDIFLNIKKLEWKINFVSIEIKTQFNSTPHKIFIK